MQQYAWLVGTQYKAMELVKSDWVAIRNSPPWAIDSWGMGKYSNPSAAFVCGFYLLLGVMPGQVMTT